MHVGNEQQVLVDDSLAMPTVADAQFQGFETRFNEITEALGEDGPTRESISATETSPGIVCFELTDTRGHFHTVTMKIDNIYQTKYGQDNKSVTIEGFIDEMDDHLDLLAQYQHDPLEISEPNVSADYCDANSTQDGRAVLTFQFNAPNGLGPCYEIYADDITFIDKD